MSIIALLAPALFDAIEIARPQMVCAFSGADGPGLPAEVRILDTDFGMTANGQFKVDILLGSRSLVGRVVPYEKSHARDVVMRARDGGDAIYHIALRDDGTALLRYRAADGAETLTSRGSCTGFEPHLDRWLAF